MKDLEFYPCFVFRVPSFPMEGITNLHLFKEALYLASPQLYYEYEKLLNQNTFTSKDKKKLISTLYKYQSRASHRCTPFGLFAAIGTGTWTNQSSIQLNATAKNNFQRKTRLDMNVSCRIASQIANKLVIKKLLKYYPNSSIYLLGNKYRYIEYHYEKNKRIHKISAVDRSIYLKKILEDAIKGLTSDELINTLTSMGIEEQEANAFFLELVEAQLLINELEPNLTGTDYFAELSQQVKVLADNHSNPEIQELSALLYNINEDIKNKDVALVNHPLDYKLLYEKFKTILPELEENNLLQTDLFIKTESAQLSNGIQKQLSETISFLDKITAPYENRNLKTFIAKFQERYEEAEVPLLLALDVESGIGYPVKNNQGINELIDDIHFPETVKCTTIEWNDLQNCLLKLIEKSLSENLKEIEISETDFSTVHFERGQLMPTFSINFKVLDKNDSLFIKNIGGSSAINLLGRFAMGNKTLENIVSQLAEHEQKTVPEFVFAEIVHLPESRTGNILARPQMRSYEIPYLAKASVEKSKQINTQDLYIKIRNNRLVLFDKRLKKEIYPMLGNAHNFSAKGLPVYHFLCDLQLRLSNKPYLNFNWGILANTFKFLPRVKYKKVVISPAIWNLEKKELEPLQDKTKSESEIINAFYTLKTSRNLPDKFIVADGDNELLIDCSTTSAVDAFIDLIKNRRQLIIEEFLFNQKEALIKDELNNTYTNECLALILNSGEIKTKLFDEFANENQMKILFPPGTEWLYFKIYCGVKTADKILVEILKPLLDSFLNTQLIDQWFFIRYSDPESHIRLRLHLTDIKELNLIIEALKNVLEPLLTTLEIYKIQIDTYKREVKRYGARSIELVEYLFFCDSVFVVELLSLLKSAVNVNLKWLMAVKSVDSLLNDFKFNTEQKAELIQELQLSFFKEHGGQKALKINLDIKYRKIKTEVDEFLSYDNKLLDNNEAFNKLLKKRFDLSKTTIEKLLAMSSGNELKVELSALLASILHMNLDRLFMGRNRSNEFVIYDILNRYYKSFVIKNKKLN